MYTINQSVLHLKYLQLPKKGLKKINSVFFIIYVNIWLIFDFTVHLMKNNTAFTVLYTLYFLQLSIVTILCPGTTLLMMSFLVEYVDGFPITVNATVLSAICLTYCIVQISSLTPYKKLVLSKLLTLVLGILTTYAFVATSVYIVQMIIKGNTKFKIQVFCI